MNALRKPLPVFGPRLVYRATDDPARPTGPGSRISSLRSLESDRTYGPERPVSAKICDPPPASAGDSLAVLSPEAPGAQTPQDPAPPKSGVRERASPRQKKAKRSSLQAKPASRPDPDPDPEREHDAEATRLMACFRDSHSDADFEALYAHTQQAVAAWIRSLLRQGPSQVDAGEILQDTFVNVYRYPRSFRDENASSFRVWVRTIAGNLVRRSRTPAMVQLSEWGEGASEPADPSARPDELADLSEEASSLDAALRLFLAVYREAWLNLGERDRLALELVEARGLTHAAAARCLGVQATNMKMIVFRARKRVAQAMRLQLTPKLH